MPPKAGGAGPANVRELLAREIERLRKSEGRKVSREDLHSAVRATDSVVSAYSDALFAKAVSLVDLVADGRPTGQADEIRTALRAAVDSFGGQESEFRRKSELALKALDRVDRRVADEARALFACANRAEVLLLGVSIEASEAATEGMLRNMDELAEMVGAGSSVKSSHRLKICLLGEAAVGKTSLIRRFVQGTFAEDYGQTVGTRISGKEIALPSPGGDGIARVTLSVWDIMGHQRLGRLTQSFLLGANGALCVFSVDSSSSLKELEEWMKAMERAVGRIPLVILANKADMEEKQVAASELPRIAKKYGCEVLPTSAKTGLNVELAFSSVVRQVLAAANAPPK